MLGPLAFIIYINDIDATVATIDMILKFADDTKLGNRAMNQEDRDNLQVCLNNLVDWADLWGMEFNINKCKVMHLGRQNINHTYYMNNVPLSTTNEERDVGIIVHNSLKPNRQCTEAAKRANIVLGQITRSFMYRDRFVFLRLYKQYVRCHLEYCVQAWSPWTAGDIEVLEAVQRRAVRQISGLKGSSYEEKLEELGLESLVDRRKRLDLIQTYKIINGVDNVNKDNWFRLTDNTSLRQIRLSSHPHNLVRQIVSRTDVRNNSFSQRVINNWNNLPDHVKNSRNVYQFKKNYSRFLQDARSANQ